MTVTAPDDHVWDFDERLERIAALRAVNPQAYGCLDPSVHAELAAYLSAKAEAAAAGPPPVPTG